jgi:group I intron endonuclease
MQVYRITHRDTGVFYVGCTTKTLEKRIKRHIVCKTSIGRLMNEHGKDAFDIELLEETEDAEREKFWIQTLHDVAPEKCLNKNVQGLWKDVDETRRKISEANRDPSDETRRKMSEARRNQSAETRRKISEAKRGKKHSEEARRKISEALRGENNPLYGKKHSEEARRKMSESKRGENNPNFGKTKSDETRRKISETIKRYWERKRKECEEELLKKNGESDSHHSPQENE